MTFASKLLIGSTASLLLGAFVVMYVTHFRVKEQMREEFATKSEAAVENLGKVLSKFEGDESGICGFLNHLSSVGQFSYLSLKHGNASICFFGQEKYSGFNLGNIDSSIKKLEENKIYSTFAQIECIKPGCKSLELEAGISFAELNRNLEILWKNHLHGTMAKIICALLFLTLFSFFVKRRLEVLSSACLQIQNGIFDLRLNISGKDEISNIGRAMKVMANGLKAAEMEKDRQRSNSQHISKMTALGEMAAGVAHEINNPLMIISGKAQHTLKKVRKGELDAKEIETGLEKIISTSTRIGKIISGLRSFSRSAEKDPEHPTLLRQIIDDTGDLCGEKFRQNGMRFEIKDIPNVVVKCRAVQISQVLLNLLNNSYDAISNNPEKWIRLSVENKDGWVLVRVTDSGRGIPQEIAEKMMQPFFTTKEVGKGTGLGLSVSCGIIAEHGGRLYYELDGGNTSFVVMLPVIQESSRVAS